MNVFYRNNAASFRSILATDDDFHHPLNDIHQSFMSIIDALCESRSEEFALDSSVLITIIESLRNGFPDNYEDDSGQTNLFCSLF